MGFREHIKLVTFDATNTLLRFRKPPWKYYSDVAREHGYSGTDQIVEHRFLSSFKTMAEKYPNFGMSTINWENWWKQVVKLTFDGQLPASADVDSVASKLIDDFKTTKCWCTVAGGISLVGLLRSYGIYTGIISNFDPRLNNLLQNVSMRDVFDFVLTSYEAGYSKPDKRIFHHAITIAEANLSPQQCLHVGDDVKKDYWGARDAGWHALLITDKTLAERPPAPEHVFNTFLDLSLAIKTDKLQLC